MGLLQEMFSYPFLVRAMIGGICISLCASLLGVSLVLKRYSMIGDGLSHVSFGALSIAVAFNWAPLAVSIPVVAAAAVLLLRITGNGKIKSDAAIAMISAGSLAIGIIVTSLTTGMTTDVSSYMFGSILAMSREYRNIIAVVMLCTIFCTDHILIDDLQSVVMNILFIYERDVLGRTIITSQYLNIILLYLSGLFHDMLIWISNSIFEKIFPFCVRKSIIIQFF